MTQAIFHPAAGRELEEAIDHYNAERQGLGREFREEVQRVLALLTRFPRLGQPVRGSVRRIMLSRFPYHIYYRLLESDNLRILAVAHNRRRPEYWVVGNRALTMASGPVFPSTGGSECGSGIQSPGLFIRRAAENS
jgi:toxin ParE1/3/4